MKIFESTYKNKRSIVLESEVLRAEFLPEPGGKMASLIYKPNMYELLVQRKGDIYLDQPFAGVYIDGECSGFDDMFPTIDECSYQEEPWKDIKMADHGEVWSLAWEPRVAHDGLQLEVSGVRFQYKLKKQISFLDHHKLRIAYSLTNESSFDFEYLWAAHLMINMEQGAKITVPGDCRQTVSVLSNIDRPYGELNDWPNMKDRNGELYRADIGRGRDAEGFEKFYFANAFTEGYCTLDYPDQSFQLKLGFPPKEVPYLGLLVNEAGWKQPGWEQLYSIFIEPCTVSYDRPDIAKKYGQVSVVRGAETINWHLDIEVHNLK